MAILCGGGCENLLVKSFTRARQRKAATTERAKYESGACCSWRPTTTGRKILLSSGWRDWNVIVSGGKCRWDGRIGDRVGDLCDIWHRRLYVRPAASFRVTEYKTILADKDASVPLGMGWRPNPLLQCAIEGSFRDVSALQKRLTASSISYL